MGSRIVIAVLLGFAAAFVAPGPAVAEAPACTTIRVVVPYAVGSATDLIARAYGETINRRNDGPLLRVVNVTRDSVREEVANARPDGCTLLVTTQALVAEKMADAARVEWKRFQPVAMMTRTPLAVVARGNLKDANLPNLIEKALEDPDSVGIGEARSALERMLLMWFEDATGARFRIMTYPSGRQSMLALLSGKLDIGLISVTGAKRRGDQKELQVLAVTTEARSPLLPDIATLTEQGIAAAFGIDRGILAPKDTPEDVVNEISSWFEKASEDAALSELLAEYATRPMYMKPDGFTRYFENLVADWRDLIERSAGKQIRRQPT